MLIFGKKIEYEDGNEIQESMDLKEDCDCFVAGIMDIEANEIEDKD